MKKTIYILTPVLATAVILMMLAKLSFVWIGSAESQGQLIVTVRLTKNILKTCRAYTEAELKTIPIHMRQAQLCDTNAIPYNLKLSLDDTLLSEETLTPQSTRGDHPMNFQKKISLDPGPHLIGILLKPAPTDISQLNTYTYSESIKIEAGKKIFVTLDESTGKFAIY